MIHSTCEEEGMIPDSHADPLKVCQALRDKLREANTEIKRLNSLLRYHGIDGYIKEKYHQNPHDDLYYKNTDTPSPFTVGLEWHEVKELLIKEYNL
jgi:hypothetical protein